MEQLRKEWNYDALDEAMGVSKLLFNADKVTISNLEAIRSELIPNCKHPKKMQDRASNGQLYCMNCNFDLD
ncbi:hypothetical protein BD31_I0833 [Candidatus Nitrosopumilus salaria BD31]|uniref:Uncharacterized protein n=1 Tax=Candidatus Nitrosopumilus salarius BD31 TaxID=859350 RepID=I3D209_9ARCH|nr:hypothetical protein [Candidatus Nitrosopumilus salaria]EIJ65752.1 hypothetical protein BD31_I0833 [Candidatus Nitrosopumilus salaria BD31]